MSVNVNCDSANLARFLDNDLPDSERIAFENHIEHCSSCRQKLDDEVAEQAWWNEIRVHLDSEAAESSRLDPDAVNDDEMDSAVDEPSVAANDAHVERVLSVLAPTDDPRSLGKLGSYDIVGVIGSGGMGVVLKAHDHSLNRFVAIKVLSPFLATSGASRKRFAREAQAAAAVLHENVIAIHGVSECSGLPFLVMPYERCESLRTRLQRSGPLQLIEILRIASQAANGLAAAHAQGLVHRDIKPANILLADSVERVTITDFGLARAVDDASLTCTGMISGTPQFMSPEQARGEAIDQRSDLFSLGSVLYAMCTGRAPFRGETSYSILRRIIDDQPESIRKLNPEIPGWLCGIIEKLMAKRPEERFDNAAEVAELLSHCMEHIQQPTSAALPLTAKSLAKKPRRRKLGIRAGLIAVVLLLACAAGAIILVKMGETTVRLEIEDPSLSVTLNNDLITISDDGKKIQIRPGTKNMFRVFQNNQIIDSRTFQLLKGQKVVLRVGVDERGKLALRRNLPSVRLVRPPARRMLSQNELADDGMTMSGGMDGEMAMGGGGDAAGMSAGGSMDGSGMGSGMSADEMGAGGMMAPGRRSGNMGAGAMSGAMAGGMDGGMGSDMAAGRRRRAQAGGAMAGGMGGGMGGGDEGGESMMGGGMDGGGGSSGAGDGGGMMRSSGLGGGPKGDAGGGGMMGGGDAMASGMMGGGPGGRAKKRMRTGKGMTATMGEEAMDAGMAPARVMQGASGDKEAGAGGDMMSDMGDSMGGEMSEGEEGGDMGMEAMMQGSDDEGDDFAGAAMDEEGSSASQRLGFTTKFELATHQLGSGLKRIRSILEFRELRIQLPTRNAGPLNRESLSHLAEVLTHSADRASMNSHCWGLIESS